MKTITKFGCIALFLMAAAMVAGACNTVKGAGEDIESTGEFISDTAEDAAN